MIKTMNSKMTRNSQLSTHEPKNRNKNKKKKIQSRQLEQKRNHRNGDHMDGYQQRVGEGKMGKKVKGIRSIIGRRNIDGERLRIV